jgi:hypothetical protein
LAKACVHTLKNGRSGFQIDLPSGFSCHQTQTDILMKYAGLGLNFSSKAIEHCPETLSAELLTLFWFN